MAKEREPSIWDILDKPAVFTGEVRKITRPVISKRAVTLSVIFRLLITGIAASALALGIYLLWEIYAAPPQWQSLFFITVLSCYFLLFIISLKRILIFAVTLYQIKASDEVRLRCNFTPSCSEYMILSLNKYGVICGTYKGIKRLLRCRLPNGGEDYP